MALKNVHSLRSAPQTRAAKVAALRQLVQVTERAQPRALPGAWQLGLEAVDAALPAQGLARDGLHEIAARAYGDEGAAAGFTLSLLKRFLALKETRKGAPLLWCQNEVRARDHGRLYAAGLARFGIDPGGIIFVKAARDREALWVLEEAARCAGLCAIIGEVASASFTQTRRLTLAAVQGGLPILLLRSYQHLPATAAATRWRIGASRSAACPFDGRAGADPGWRVELARCRGGRPHQWCVEWRHETHCFGLVSPSCREPSGARAEAEEKGRLIAFG